MGWKDWKYWQKGLVIVISIWLVFFLFSLFIWISDGTCDFGSPDGGNSSSICTLSEFFVGNLILGGIWLIVFGFIGAFIGAIIDIMLHWKTKKSR